MADDEALTGAFGYCLLWVILWLATGKSYAFPGGVLFALQALFAFSVVGGKLAALCRLPALFGMLCFGFAARNIHADTFTLDTSWSTVLRNFAIDDILSRAGWTQPAALRRLSAAVIRLAFLPDLVELLLMRPSQ